MSKKELRLTEILKNAVDLFIEKGIYETLTSDISKRTGIAAGTLFNYFSTQEELITTLYMEIKESLWAELNGCFTDMDSIEQMIKNVWDVFIDWGVTHYSEILFLRQMEESPYISVETKQKIERNYYPFAMKLQQSITRGTLKDLPLELIGKNFYQLLISTIEYTYKNSKTSKLDVKELKDKSVDILLNGILK